MTDEKINEVKGARLRSLDLFRGVTMFLLVAEGTHLYNALAKASASDSVFHHVVMQFFHHEWHGLHFWDLVQPYFMFIVGVAMVFSLNKRWGRGDTWLQTFRHILVRCGVLLLFGVGLHLRVQGKARLGIVECALAALFYDLSRVPDFQDADIDATRHFVRPVNSDGIVLPVCLHRRIRSGFCAGA